MSTLSRKEWSNPIPSTNFNDHSENRPICHLVIASNKLLGSKTCIYLSQYDGEPSKKLFRRVYSPDSIYEPFCDDFGPMNALAIVRFIETLDSEIACLENGQGNIVYCADPGRRSLTNAAFLLGAYMVIKLGMAPKDIAVCFEGLDSCLFEPYRDASYGKPTFGLDLIDCWQGLFRGKQEGWITMASKIEPTRWGLFDAESYAHYDNPLNADLHEIVPRKLIAFRGPKALGGREFCNHFEDGVFQFRQFSPEYYIEILKDFRVETIIRLSDPVYDESVFVSNGFRHYDLPFNFDTSTPTPMLVTRFFKIIDEAKGAVAIHGGSSFGRAGTLAALYLMRSHEFSAREAIAWVRIMRPGSIIGSQQHYLCTVEQSITRLVSSMTPAASSLPTASAAATTGGEPAATASASKAVDPAVRRRGVLRSNSMHASFLDVSSSCSRPPRINIETLPTVACGSSVPASSSGVGAGVGGGGTVAAFDPLAARRAMSSRRSSSVADLMMDDERISPGPLASAARAAFAAVGRRGSLSLASPVAFTVRSRPVGA